MDILRLEDYNLHLEYCSWHLNFHYSVNQEKLRICFYDFASDSYKYWLPKPYGDYKWRDDYPRGLKQKKFLKYKIVSYKDILYSISENYLHNPNPYEPLITSYIVEPI